MGPLFLANIPVLVLDGAVIGWNRLFGSYIETKGPPKRFTDYPFIIGMFAFALLYFFLCLPRLWFAYESSKWASVDGYVQETSPEIECRNGKNCIPLISYSYTLDGVPFYGWKITPVVQESYTPYVARKLLMTYHAGKKVRVFYDPNDPESSCLEAGFNTNLRAEYLYLIVGIVTAAAGTVALIKRKKSGRRAWSDL